MTLDYQNLVNYTGIPIIDYKTSVVRVGDIANRQIQDKVVQNSYEFSIAQTLPVATMIADDLLRGGAYPTMDISFPANRKANRLQVGDNFKFSYSKYGIVDKICLVTDIDEGDLSSETITVYAKESIYHLSKDTVLNRSTLGSSGQEQPSILEPLNKINYLKIIETPYDFAGESVGVFTIASREPNNLTKGYLVFISTDDGISYNYLETVISFAPHGVLVNDYIEDTYTIDDYIGFEIDSLDGNIQNINNLTRERLFTNDNIALLGDEIISFQTIYPHDSIDNRYIIENVRRAQGDTLKQEHLSGADFFFLGGMRGMHIQTPEIVVGAALKFKYVPYEQSVGDISEAIVLEKTIEGRAKKPYRPDNFMSGGIMTNPFYTADIVLTWDSMVRGEGAGVGLPEIITDAAPVWEGKFEIEVYVFDILVRTVSNIDALTWTYTSIMNLADNTSLADIVVFKLSNYLLDDNNYKYASAQKILSVTKE